MFEHGSGRVDRYYLPGSMRSDPLGKSAAQEILDFEVPIPASLLT